MSNDDSGGGSDPYGRYRQMEVYTAGMLADQTPEYPIAYEELEARATEVLSPEAYGYVAGGAGAERTAEANGRALSRWRLVPRMLRNVATVTSLPPCSASNSRCPSCSRRSAHRGSSTRTAI